MKMKPDTVLDYAIFELSARHSRCDLFVSSNGETEKLASGLIQPFVNHLRVLEAQSSFRVEVDKSENDKSWFTRRTLERFVQFVNSPEVLERVNTFDLEMSQLEAARILYSQDDGGVTDATKKELGRAIDLRLDAIKKDLATAIAHASANGFDPHSVSDLQHFADRFGAHRLDEACGKYISLWQRRPDLITENLNTITQHTIGKSECTKSNKNEEEEKKDESLDESSRVKTSQHTRKLSVQDRINLFESKQKENSNSGGNKPVAVTKSTELRRLSSDVSSTAPAFSEKSVLRRWSIVSDMSFDLAVDNKKSESSSNEEGSSITSLSVPDATVPKESEEKSKMVDDDLCSSKCDDSQNQTDRPGNIVTDGNVRQREEESYASKSNNVAYSRSRSAHIVSATDIKSDEFQAKDRKTEVFRSDKQPVSTSLKQASAGSEQIQESFGVEDDLEVSLTNADSAGKNNNNRVRATSVDQLQRRRMSRENPAGANDELKLKADELEKIFAEHKLRVLPGDQSAGDDQDSSGTVVTRRNLSDLSFSEDSKGKLYEQYMKKRDAKLREEWSSKETKLKSMQEALDRSRTEMKAKFSAASTKAQDSISTTRQRAEKLRSFNSRSSMKKYQHPISSLQSEEEDQKDKPLSGKYIGNSASRSSQVRKIPSPNRGSRVSKPSGKVSNSNITSGRGRRTSEINPVAQSSVPSFSDLKKENTKPSSLAVRNSTAVMRTQVRSSNTKNTKEDIPSPGKARRSRSLRKSCSGNIEFTELTTLYSDDMVNKERNHKQNTDIDDVSENFKSEEFNEIDSEAEEEEKEVLENPVKEEVEVREIETLVVEDIADEKPSLSDKIENSSEDEGFTSLRSVSHVELPTNTPPSSTFQRNVVSLMDSPSESPLSWNSNLQHAFSYPHDHSDVDASVDDSPMGSPASWSSRMRKKWGTTGQSPVIASNSSPLHSRKDLAKGIKRLLKFGKKTRAADSLMDWVSVTTSEGDDDFAYRSSDELRKSRMAYSQSQLSEDEQASNNSIHQASFKVKDGDFKRSFFSLSTFRTKGNDSKPR